MSGRAQDICSQAVSAVTLAPKIVRTNPTRILDGHLVTIVTDSGEELVGFASWESDNGSSQIDHVYINGEHFWNRKKWSLYGGYLVVP